MGIYCLYVSVRKTAFPSKESFVNTREVLRL